MTGRSVRSVSFFAGSMILLYLIFCLWNSNIAMQQYRASSIENLEVSRLLENRLPFGMSFLAGTEGRMLQAQIDRHYVLQMMRHLSLSVRWNVWQRDAFREIERLLSRENLISDHDLRLEILEEYRAALISSRSLWFRGSDQIHILNTEISNLRTENGKQRVNILQDLEGADRRSFPASLVLSLGFVAWVGSCVALGWKGFTSEGMAVPKTAGRWMFASMVFLLVWVLALRWLVP